MMHLRIFLGILSVLVVAGCVQKSTTRCPNTSNTTSKAVYKATMRPYSVKGQYYTPEIPQKREKMYGISSWYGPNFHGKCTSNGEKYNMYARTAAHKTLPMDTIVRVKNLENGKSTVVRINDRGPFVKGRIIDCSYRAGKELGLDKTGIAKVEIEVLKTKYNKTKQHPIALSLASTGIKRDKIGVQIGAFRSYEGALAYKNRFKNRYKPYYPVIYDTIDKIDRTRLYRVVLRGFSSQDDASTFKKETMGML